MTDEEEARAALKKLLGGFSAEVTTHDGRALAAADALPRGTEVFIAFVPSDRRERQIEMAAALRAKGLEPVPHVVARNIPTKTALDDYLGGLASARVTRALVLGGDRDAPAGEFDSALRLIESGLLAKHGIKDIFLGVYPEIHPRISEDVLAKARADKIKAAEAAGHGVTLINQVCFDAGAVLRFIRMLRADGVAAPFRVGVAGPAKIPTLIRYAMICGVGPSMRFLTERRDAAADLLRGDTPEEFLTAIAIDRKTQPELGIEGVHFFTFGGLKRAASFAHTLLED
jgi:methylenetetrahydrofolate reductase (NADPH)